jgi:hypothetical protein
MKCNNLFLALGLFLCSHCAIAQWIGYPSMSTTRAGHTSTALEDGRLLVAGGWDYSINLSSAEVYDPISNAWTSVPSMDSEHYNARAVRLEDGNVLIIAGFTGVFNTEACELFNPTDNVWESAGFLSQGRSYFTATKLNDGKVLVVGGYDGTNNLNSCEIYNPQTNTWSAAASINTARSYHTANILPDGKVLIAGGFNPNAGFQLSSVEIYDPSNDSWSAGSPMIIARDYHASTIMSDGRIMVSGGRYFNGSVNYAYNGIIDVEIYDPNTQQWQFDEPLPLGLSYHEMITLEDGNILAIAGVDSSNTSDITGFTTYASSTFLYDAVAGEWTENPLLQDSRYEFSVAALSNGTVLVTGGVDASVEAFNVSTGHVNLPSEKAALIYPNPANRLITLKSFDKQFLSSSLQLIDIYGKSISISLTIYDAKTFVINTQGIASGVYSLRFQDVEGLWHAEKVVIAH